MRKKLSIIFAVLSLCLGGNLFADIQYEFDKYISGGVVNPCAITSDSTGNIYVGQYEGYIKKLNSDGELLLSFGEYGYGEGQFLYVSGIAVDSEGYIYITDYQNHRVLKFDSAGEFVLTFGGAGSGDGEFFYPAGIAVDDSGNIYVTEVHNHRVQKFDSEGKYLLTIGGGGSGSGEGEFSFPYGIALDNSGNIYVTDKYNHRVQKFNSSGEHILTFGGEGDGDDEFSYPDGIVVDDSGNIYVMDTNHGRVQKFASSGEYILTFKKYLEAEYLMIDASGYIYVSGNNSLLKFDSEGNYLSKFAEGFTSRDCAFDAADN
ncbi:MAG: 6-bladed beta-propeller, partial [bacterium]|nr:6-bladed beta-propeller [bacterium]